MIVSLHVAAGGAAGALVGTRRGALALGPVLHLLGDLMPHEDIDDMAFEGVSGGALLLAFALRYGPTSPVTIGAAAASAPDIEHVLLHGRKLFPTHRFAGWHRSGGAPAWLQLLAAGAIAGTLLGLVQPDNG